MAEPVGFAGRMEGLAYVPEPLWWLLGAIVGFYFGARELHYVRQPRVEMPLPEPRMSAWHAPEGGGEGVPAADGAPVVAPRAAKAPVMRAPIVTGPLVQAEPNPAPQAATPPAAGRTDPAATDANAALDDWRSRQD